MTKVSATSSEKLIFDAVAKNDAHLLKTLLVEKQKVNIFDENSMTPLQHAAYKGSREMVQALLDQGADVNVCQHQHGYSALHFAGLSGNADVCTLLLMAGAKSHVTNSVGRTPSQMAAFVGNHSCVSAINNFIPMAQVEYYTLPHGQQTKPTLSPFLAESFHKFLTQSNVNPVRVTLNIQKMAGLADHLGEINATLEPMCTREMKNGNEVMAFKFHYLGCVVAELIDSSEPQADKGETFDVFYKKLLKPNKDGNLESADVFLRGCVRKFPFRECTILRQMVASLTGKDPPSALNVIMSAINGHRGFADNDPVCSACGEEKPLKKCSKCKTVQYCDRECQKLHWFVHKKICAKLDPLTQIETPKPSPRDITADMQNLLTN